MEIDRIYRIYRMRRKKIDPVNSVNPVYFRRRWQDDRQGSGRSV
jgi:hypothetical protein